MPRRHAVDMLAALALAALLAGAGSACAIPGTGAREEALQRYAAERDRADSLERDLSRLRADLAQAEAVLVAMESGLKGTHTRASGVSALAEARVLVDRAARAAPWRETEIGEARAKLVEADRQLQDGHVGSAVFFASRARRIGEALLLEARHVERAQFARVGAVRANLRSGPSTTDPIVGTLAPSTPVVPGRRDGQWLEVRTPSGESGWIHQSLLR